MARIALDSVPDGFEAFALARIVEEIGGNGPVVHVLRDGQRLNDFQQLLAFVAPDLPVLSFPGWDCLPYDRVSPSADVAARRLAALTSLIAFRDNPHKAVILTTVNAIIQKLPPRDVIVSQGISAKPGNRIDMNELARRLENAGFDRVPTVRDVGEFAVRAVSSMSLRPARRIPSGSISSAIRSSQSALSMPRHSAQQVNGKASNCLR